MTNKKKPTVKGGKPAKKAETVKKAKAITKSVVQSTETKKTVAMLKTELEGLGIKFKAKATKPELEALLNTATTKVKNTEKVAKKSFSGER